MYIIKHGDTDPPIRMQILLNGAPLDLSDVDTVTWRMQLRPPGVTFITGLMSVLDATQGKVSYTWQPGDTDVIGLYLCELRLARGVKRETVPNSGFIQVRIIEST